MVMSAAKTTKPSSMRRFIASWSRPRSGSGSLGRGGRRTGAVVDVVLEPPVRSRPRPCDLLTDVVDVASTVVERTDVVAFFEGRHQRLGDVVAGQVGALRLAVGSIQSTPPGRPR